MITSYRSPNCHRVIDGFVNPDRLIDGFLKLDRLIDGLGKCWSIEVMWFDDRYHQKRQTSINTPATVPQVCICSQTHIVYTTYICYLNTIVEHVQKVLQCFMTCWGNIISYWHPLARATLCKMRPNAVLQLKLNRGLLHCCRCLKLCSSLLQITRALLQSLVAWRNLPSADS